MRTMYVFLLLALIGSVFGKAVINDALSVPMLYLEQDVDSKSSLNNLAINDAISVQKLRSPRDLEQDVDSKPSLNNLIIKLLPYIPKKFWESIFSSWDQIKPLFETFL